MSILQFVCTGVLLDILNVLTAAAQPGSLISPAFPTHSHHMKFEWQPDKRRAEAISKLSQKWQRESCESKAVTEKKHPHGV